MLLHFMPFIIQHCFFGSRNFFPPPNHTASAHKTAAFLRLSIKMYPADIQKKNPAVQLAYSGFFFHLYFLKRPPRLGRNGVAADHFLHPHNVPPTPLFIAALRKMSNQTVSLFFMKSDTARIGICDAGV